MANLVVSAVSTWDNSGLKKGQKSLSSFDKSINRVAKSLSLTFGAAALANYGKKAVAAFMADEKAAKSLEVQLRNTGFAFSAPGVEQYIARLQGLYGVLDDELRPAFQQLLTATGSITKSQDALQTALNVSAATGRSLSEVSAALTRGFSGNTTGLSRLGAGISKATLKSGDMNKIMEELNAKFASQAAARLETFAGKMSLITVASADAKEIIGKGLVDALTNLGNDKSIGNFTDSMTELAKGIADVTRGIGELGRGITTIANLPGLKQLITFSYETSAIGLLQRLGRMSAPAAVLPANEQRSAGRISSQQFRIEIRQKKELDRLRALELALLKKKTAVDALRDKFDIERIGLAAALNAATDEETKLRIKAQIAILDNNESLAKKILAEMQAAEAAAKLAAAADSASAAFARLAIFNPLSGLRSTEADILATLGATATRLGTLGKRSSGDSTMFPPATTPYDPLSSLTTTTADLESTGYRYDPLSGIRATAQDIRITIDTASSGDKLSQAIAESIQIATRSGYSTTPAGFLV